jgi:hypothetical protein
MLRSHSISFTRAQGIPNLVQDRVGKGNGWSLIPWCWVECTTCVSHPAPCYCFTRYLQLQPLRGQRLALRRRHLSCRRWRCGCWCGFASCTISIPAGVTDQRWSGYFGLGRRRSTWSISPSKACRHVRAALFGTFAAAAAVAALAALAAAVASSCEAQVVPTNSACSPRGGVFPVRILKSIRFTRA